jgi:hypothetical protein
MIYIHCSTQCQFLRQRKSGLGTWKFTIKVVWVCFIFYTQYKKVSFAFTYIYFSALPDIIIFASSHIVIGIVHLHQSSVWCLCWFVHFYFGYNQETNQSLSFSFHSVKSLFIFITCLVIFYYHCFIRWSFSNNIKKRFWYSPRSKNQTSDRTRSYKILHMQDFSYDPVTRSDNIVSVHFFQDFARFWL